jgi:UDP-N-acetylglucosamine--N-acetylmuramyl-(pentapeptide) pyrophosphoryl-undecaprenol N-acetylglucosamine transferase
VSFEETARWFPRGRTEITGLPVREEFAALKPKPRSDVTTVLITGGSQGSRTLNRAAEQAWPLLKSAKIRLIHQTGLAAYEEIAARFRSAGVDGEITPFFSDMPAAFAQADLVISRAGAGTVSELAAAGKPSILVPLPTASDQHQLRNAQAFERAGASRLLLDSETTGARLVEEIAKLSDKLDQMAASVRSLAHPGAARRAAEVLESFIA